MAGASISSGDMTPLRARVTCQIFAEPPMAPNQTSQGHMPGSRDMAPYLCRAANGAQSNEGQAGKKNSLIMVDAKLFPMTAAFSNKHCYKEVPSLSDETSLSEEIRVDPFATPSFSAVRDTVAKLI